ncbi:hypothetical protein DWT61_08185 [Campylobacter jejuni]|nr:hypothetical protein [Campylobacter jejuni]EAL9374707.1 hypothetical protein [Campylobacter jejuni]EAL9420519.1 hypothetical protein [Campylobacter jejuni]
MFLDFIGKAFIFIIIHLMTIFIAKSHIAVIKTSFQSFDFRFIFIYNLAFIVILKIIQINIITFNNFCLFQVLIF